jgi:predicted RNase H-like HicB family nuclease
VARQGSDNTVVVGYIAVSMVVEPDEGQFEAYCPELDVSSFGDTREEATRNLEEALTLYLDSLTSHGEIIDELKRRNVEIHRAMPDTLKVHASVRSGGCVSPFMTSVPAAKFAFA